MLFMVIERFKERDPAAIYARLGEQGRALPEGLRYVESWVEANFDRIQRTRRASIRLPHRRPRKNSSNLGVSVRCHYRKSADIHVPAQGQTCDDGRSGRGSAGNAAGATAARSGRIRRPGPGLGR
jgi:hypothetical protein